MSILKSKFGTTVPRTLVSPLGLSAVVLVLFLLSSYFCALWAAETRVSITQHQGFEQLRHNLQALVEIEGKREDSHHFFIANYPPGRDFTYMFWREGRALWILELGDESSHHWESAIATPRSGTRINLDLDVVDDPGTSTYLVETTWVQNIIYDAVLNGDLVVVNKKPLKNRGD